MDAQMDWEAFEARTRTAMGAGARAGLVTGGTNGMRHSGFSVVMHGGQPTGSSFSFRGVFPRDGIPRLRFRRVAHAGGFQFVELMVGVRADAVPRIVDVWSLNTGENLSRTLAEGLGGIHAADPSLLRRIDGQRNPWTDHGEELSHAQTLIMQGEGAQALAILDALPQVMRESRLISLLRVRAASSGDPARDAEVLDEVAALRPDDPAVLVMLIDRHAIAERWAEAAEDIRRIAESMPDPYLDALRAKMERLAGHAEVARALADAALAAEPDLLDAHDVSMLIALQQADTATADRELVILMQRFGVDAERLAAMQGYSAIRTLQSFPAAAPEP